VQPVIGFEELEHLKAVQIGHQEIEQDQIDILDLENLQRSAARLRPGYIVTIVAEAPE
jgi:hypothetical protein